MKPHEFLDKLAGPKMELLRKIRTDGLYVLYHKRCQQPAFYYEVRPQLRDVPQANLAWLLSGSRPNHIDRMFCGSCRRSMKPGEIDLDRIGFINEQED